MNTAMKALGQNGLPELLEDLVELAENDSATIMSLARETGGNVSSSVSYARAVEIKSRAQDLLLLFRNKFEFILSSPK